ncbi:ribosomal peptide maturation radical SAM protein 1 [Yoonia maritima]|uniref:Ribosomal peptide maturation radical SAM protein 1 n=1 Tax=Yoonia maritima TaxID=1435347 RepID=A0A2T0VVD3_9RHOB|nr:RiPP maturation radical SAM C-methyltransferase [Yoonia maritima]PRY75528.1 ribosomal peptide maturation radical SAM protein 1 [Yoonia maritima]
MGHNAARFEFGDTLKVADNPKPLKVGLVCAPFFSIDYPSIQIGLLAAIAQSIGAQVSTYHLTVYLAQRIGADAYHSLCQHRGRMTGDWLFSVAAFGGEVDTDDNAYFKAFPEEIDGLCEKLDCDRPYLTELRHRILPEFIDACMTNEDWTTLDVVGFTSTFQQNVASLALARRIKSASPDTKIVFGGANFEDEMGPEYVRAFDCIDYAVSGEGETAFPKLLKAIRDGKSGAGIPGVIARQGQDVSFTPANAEFSDLNAQPIPIYDEFFARMDATGLSSGDRYGRMLPLEGSRGCWWGEKHHCTFCGLNGTGMTYRSKDPKRLLAEIATLAKRHRITSFESVDNILDMKYLSTFFSEIEGKRLDYTFFFEVKANLNRSQVAMLQKGGVRHIQPGIESLSTNVLALMEKGCTMLQNVRLLKWSRYYRLKVGWNIIWGFPGEIAEDYATQLSAAKLIPHLEPPSGCGPIWLERFSPFYTQKDRFPIQEIVPEASYGHAYPDYLNLEKVAYFFDYVMANTQGSEHSDLRAWVAEWQDRATSDQPDTLSYRLIDDGIMIDDDRRDFSRGTHSFEGPLAQIYLECDETYCSAGQVTKRLNSKYENAHSLEEVRAALDRFCSMGLMLSENDNYLSLALPVNPGI